jgi:hypothetical protein
MGALGVMALALMKKPKKFYWLSYHTQAKEGRIKMTLTYQESTLLESF